MSWQRIFEAARSANSPVIVTDVAGREPLVVLPLTEYERLLEHRSKEPKDEVETLSPDMELSTIETPPDEFLAAVEEQEAEKPPKMEELAQEDKSGLSLEERFYLEPADEGTV